MTDLVVRKPRFEFDGSTPFQWNSTNPGFAVSMNALSFISHGFERFVVAATRAAMVEMIDESARVEADAFLRQEAVHARAHRAHTSALVEQYPGLQQVLDDIGAHYDRLASSKPLRYQLAYNADIEATFTPMFNLLLRHRDNFFDNGDPLVAPLFLWHLVEEIEHRSSAQIVYDAIVPDPWYRARQTPGVFAHMMAGFNICMRGFDAHVPPEDRGMDCVDMIVGPRVIANAVRGNSSVPPQYTAVPRREIATMVYRLARSQLPGHTPETEETPPFAWEWIDAYAAGRDVVRWYDHDTRNRPGAT